MLRQSELAQLVMHLVTVDWMSFNDFLPELFLTGEAFLLVAVGHVAGDKCPQQTDAQTDKVAKSHAVSRGDFNPAFASVFLGGVAVATEILSYYLQRLQFRP